MKPIIDISLLDLIKGCKKDGEIEYKLYSDFKKSNGEYVHEIFKNRKFGYNFNDTLTLYNDGSYVVGTIRPSYNDFIKTICNFLNVEYDSTLSEKKLTKLLMDRVEILKSVTEEKISEEFPKIKADFDVGRRGLLKLHEDLDKLKISKAFHDAKTRNDFYKCGIQINFKRFIDYQSKIYTKFITQREEYKNLIKGISYDEYISEHFDRDKVALYVAYKYLEACRRANGEKRQELLNLIYNYIDSDCDKSVSVKLGDRVINFNEIRERFSKFKMDKVAYVDWEIMPKSKTPSRVGIGGTSNRRTIILSQEEKNELINKGMAKNNFYDESNYLKRIVGKDSYYVEYLYPNGTIVKDLRFNPDKIGVTSTGAVFTYHVSDYFKLKGLINVTLRSRPEVRYYYHSGDWMSKVKSDIDREATEQDKKEVKQFRKVLNI